MVKAVEASPISPLYLTAGDEVPYCHSCGRVMSTRRKQTPTAKSSPVKYCSDRCRRSKPGPMDRQIEDAFVALLQRDVESYTSKYDASHELQRDTGRIKKAKGDSRVIVWCSDVETLVFGSRIDPLKTAGRRKNRLPRGKLETGEWKTVDMESSTELEDEDGSNDSEDRELGGVDFEDISKIDRDYIYFSAGKRCPPQSKAEANGSVGGEKGWAEKIEETEEMLQKRMEGQQRANEKEMVKRAARRGVVFGFTVNNGHDLEADARKQKKGRKAKLLSEEDIPPPDHQNQHRRKCEAVVTKAVVVVEPSFAKGDWGIRWRTE